MRRLLAVVTVAAAAFASGAPVGAQTAPATFGYTVLFGLGQQPLTCRLATVDFATGALDPLTAPPSVDACAGDLAFGPDGTLYGLVQGGDENDLFAQLVTFDLGTGEATIVGRFGPFEQPRGGVSGQLVVPVGGITFDTSGALFALLEADPLERGAFDPSCATATESATCLYRVDDPNVPESATFIGRSTSGDDARIVTFSSSCDTLYTSIFSFEAFETDQVSTVDPADGSLTSIGGLAPGWLLLGADFDRSPTFWGIVGDFQGDGTRNVATLDPAGGTPIETLGPIVPLPELTAALALAVEPLDCPVEPAPIVLEPTFTG